MSDNSQPEMLYVETFKNHQIKLDTKNWKFIAIGEEFDDTKFKITFESLHVARAEISRRTAESEKVALSNTPLELELLTETGKRVTVRKIDRRTGEIASSISSKSFYPSIDWVAKILDRKIFLEKELHQIQLKLNEIQIKSIRYSYGRVLAEDYPRLINSLNTEYKEKLEKALSNSEAFRSNPILKEVKNES